jgi:hypothetical protein
MLQKRDLCIAVCRLSFFCFDDPLEMPLGRIPGELTPVEQIRL